MAANLYDPARNVRFFSGNQGIFSWGKRTPDYCFQAMLSIIISEDLDTFSAVTGSCCHAADQISQSMIGVAWSEKAVTEE